MFFPSHAQVQGSYDSELTQLQDSFQSKIVHLLSDTVSCVARLSFPRVWVCGGEGGGLCARGTGFDVEFFFLCLL